MCVCPGMHSHCDCAVLLIELPVQKTVVAEGSPEPCGKTVLKLSQKDLPCFVPSFPLLHLHCFEKTWIDKIKYNHLPFQKYKHIQRYSSWSKMYSIACFLSNY